MYVFTCGTFPLNTAFRPYTPDHPSSSTHLSSSVCGWDNKMSRNNGQKKKVGFATHITAGGIAGGMEAVSLSLLSRAQFFLCWVYDVQLCCQPLDTIKVRMQLSKSGSAPGVSNRIYREVVDLIASSLDESSWIHSYWTLYCKTRDSPSTL